MNMDGVAIRADWVRSHVTELPLELLCASPTWRDHLSDASICVSEWKQRNSGLRITLDAPGNPYSPRSGSAIRDRPLTPGFRSNRANLQDFRNRFPLEKPCSNGSWLPATIIDVFELRRGILSVRLFGTLPFASFKGPALDKGEVMRGLAEMLWRPSGFRKQPNLIWTSETGDGLQATFDDGRIRACVSFEIDRDGRVLSVNALDRPRTVGKQSVETPWSGILADYKEVDNLRVRTQRQGQLAFA